MYSRGKNLNSILDALTDQASKKIPVESEVAICSSEMQNLISMKAPSGFC